MSKPKRGSKAKAHSYRLTPWSLALALVYALALFTMPLVRGEAIDAPSVKHALVVGVLTLLAALLAGWLAWRMVWASTWFSNAVCCAVLGAAGLWFVGFDRVERAEARQAVGASIERQVERLVEP